MPHKCPKNGILKSYNLRPLLQIKQKYYVASGKGPFAGLRGGYKGFVRHGRSPWI
jgi:hypothetical protein